MSNHDDNDHDIPALQAWAVAEGARDLRPDDDADAAAEAIVQRLGRDRMLGLWRGAVGCVAEAVQATWARAPVEPPGAAAAPTTAWAVSPRREPAS